MFETPPVTPEAGAESWPGADVRGPDWWDARYVSGETPWDTGTTPPEVVRLIESGRVEKGWALDLGCGPGVTSRFLATKGFRVVGLDLSLVALRRAVQECASSRLPCSFLRASVVDLAFLRVAATLAVDIGCFHGLPAFARQSYIRSLAAHLVPGGYYLLYAFVNPAPFEPVESGPGMTPTGVATFSPFFALRSASHGDDRGRPSAWFLMQRS